MKIQLVIFMMFMLILGSDFSFANPVQDCAQSADYELRIRGCTVIIDRGDGVSKKARAKAYGFRGIAHGKLGKIDKEVSDYSKAIFLNPADMIIRGMRGSAYVSRMKYEKALKDFDYVLSRNPKDEIARVGRGTALLGRGLVKSNKHDLRKAILEFDKAILANPKDLQALLGNGIAHGSLGNRDYAIRNFRAVLELVPKNETAIEWLKGLKAM